MTIVADTPATTIPSGTWTIDPVWSSLEFEVRKLGLATVKGRVPGFTGTIRGGDSPAVGGVEAGEAHGMAAARRAGRRRRIY